LSSITDRSSPDTRPQRHGRTGSKPARRSQRAGRNQRGQVLVLFAGALIGLMAVAALVFDVGQNLLDWRSQRDAADASALAGARYINEPG
jgi:Flp pilus assembly protein TadG